MDDTEVLPWDRSGMDVVEVAQLGSGRPEARASDGTDRGTGGREVVEACSMVRTEVELRRAVVEVVRFALTAPSYQRLLSTYLCRQWTTQSRQGFAQETPYLHLADYHHLREHNN